MKKCDLKNVVWREGKYYVAQCLNIDVSSFGKTKQDALVNLDEAINLYFDDNDRILITQIDKPEIVTSPFCNA